MALPSEGPPIVQDYLPAFFKTRTPFLTHYALDAGGTVSRSDISRGAFYAMAKKAAFVIRSTGLRKGDCFALCFGANQPLDLGFRLAAVLTGTIPVTINWQTDSGEHILYKLKQTESKLVVAAADFKTAYLRAIGSRCNKLPCVAVEDLDRQPTLDDEDFVADLTPEDIRIIVFTSGTTDRPKGVRLPYRAYATNRATFESYLEIQPKDRLALLIVNPLHHSNSTAMTDWALRRPQTHIHLVERYTTVYWKILTEVATGPYDRIVAPTVSRHFDFLENLRQAKRLPVQLPQLKQAMSRCDFLIGSAPVGPTTIERLRDYAGRIPEVRFGSTETCLQVIGIPRHLSEDAREQAFVRGWNFQQDGEARPGYYIGRDHRPHTRVRIVASVDVSHSDFMRDCPAGQAGYIVTRGGNLMAGYIGRDAETAAVFYEDWYLGLKDIGFYLYSQTDGERDYYWVSRESEMLIRGGANYAYDQINAQLKSFLLQQYDLAEEDVKLAVVGLKVASEHEDACCVTIELITDKARQQAAHIERTFTNSAALQVSKAARPDYLRFGNIPRNFKGAILVKDLAADFKEWLRRSKSLRSV